MRIETGALQIDDDWTGLFIRGDDAMSLLDTLIECYYPEFGTNQALIANLISIIVKDVDHKSHIRHVQKIRSEL